MMNNNSTFLNYLSHSLNAYESHSFSEGKLQQISGFISHLQHFSSEQKEPLDDLIHSYNYQVLVNNTNDLICSFDSDLTLNVINNAFSRIFYQTIQQELIPGQSLNSILKKERFKWLKEGIDQMFEGKQVEIPGLVIDDIHPKAVYDALFSPVIGYDKVIGGMFLAKEVTNTYTAKQLLEKKTEELGRLNDELDNFVYSASHDLRAPIASMMGLLNISSYTEDVNELKDYNKLIKKSLQKLDKVINSIINYSWNSRIDLLPEQIALEEMIWECLKFYDYIPYFSTIDFKISLRQKQPFHSDPHRLKIIIKNLLANAIQFQRPENTRKMVEINAVVSDEKLTLKIIDNGEGIPSQHLASIFNMFVRLNHSKSGAGLGLYLVKQALNKLEGNILVSSQIKKGSTFTVQIRNRGNK